MAGTAKTRKAEARLITAAPKVAQALDELVEALHDPFGPLSVGGNAQQSARGARDELRQAAQHLTEALYMLHEMNVAER